MIMLEFVPVSPMLLLNVLNNFHHISESGGNLHSLKIHRHAEAQKQRTGVSSAWYKIPEIPYGRVHKEPGFLNSAVGELLVEPHLSMLLLLLGLFPNMPHFNADFHFSGRKRENCPHESQYCFSADQ